MHASLTIAVNATALASGGGLSILHQFIDNICDEHRYYIFIPDIESLRPATCSPDPQMLNHEQTRGVFQERDGSCEQVAGYGRTNGQQTLGDSRNPNITFIRVPPMSFIKRIMWDSHGFKQWFVKKNIDPDVVVSLQNTSIAFGEKKQVIYLHQGLCLHPQKWSFFKKNERTLAMYRYIYPFFMLMHTHQNTHFVVQTEWMKAALCKRFKRKEALTHVIKPHIEPINIDQISSVSLNEPHSLFYPANGCLYKNHTILLDALYALKQSGYDMSSIALYLTINPNPDLLAQINRLELQKQVHFLGVLTANEMLQYYKSCSLVVFPSYIESFGLPLLEAAMFGKPMVVADESYAKEVLARYPYVYYAKCDLAMEWKNAIIHALSQLDIKFSSNHVPQYDSSWRDFFHLIEHVS